MKFILMMIEKSIKKQVEKMLVDRNVQIIIAFKKNKKAGKTARQIFDELADEFDVSSALIHAVVYNKNYPAATKAWKIVNSEIS